MHAAVVLIHHLMHQGTSSVMYPEVIGCFGSLEHQTPSLRVPAEVDQASACALAAQPRFRSLNPEPPRGFLCCLCAATDGSSPPFACDTECSICPAEGLSSKASTPYLYREAPCLPALFVAVAD